ncbi:hypothetical protein ACOME3_003213 [Neoechinorhynchus agilis]
MGNIHVYFLSRQRTSKLLKTNDQPPCIHGNQSSLTNAILWMGIKMKNQQENNKSVVISGIDSDVDVSLRQSEFNKNPDMNLKLGAILGAVEGRVRSVKITITSDETKVSMKMFENASTERIKTLEMGVGHLSREISDLQMGDSCRSYSSIFKDRNCCSSFKRPLRRTMSSCELQCSCGQSE